MSRKAVVLVSGTDSEVLVWDLLRRGWTVLPLYVRCGFRWETVELARLRKALRALRCPRLEPLAVTQAPMRPLLRGHWSLTGRGVPGARSRDEAVYLPGRNVVLLAEAWLHATSSGAGTVAIGTLKANPFPDASPRFRAAVRKALNLGFDAKIKLWAPYAALSKVQVLGRARGFRAELAFSCLSPRRGSACGECNKCAEFSAAMAALKRGRA